MWYLVHYQQHFSAVSAAKADGADGNIVEFEWWVSSLV